MEYIDILYLFLCGLGVGFISGMFGIGGAVIFTPILSLMGYPDNIALATPLATVIPSSISGSLVYAKEKLINYKVGLYVVVTAIIFGFAGIGLADLFPTTMLFIKFAFMFLLALDMFIQQKSTNSEDMKNNLYLLILIGAVGGFISGLLAIGGGIVFIFAFRRILKIKIKETIATSLFCFGITSIFNTYAYYLLGSIDWSVAIPIALGVIPASRFGAKLSLKTKSRTLQISFGIILIAFAIFIIMKKFVFGI